MVVLVVEDELMDRRLPTRGGVDGLAALPCLPWYGTSRITCLLLVYLPDDLKVDKLCRKAPGSGPLSVVSLL